MKAKKNGNCKVVHINSVIKMEISHKNQSVKLEFDPIVKQTVKNFYSFLSIPDRKSLINLLSLPENSVKYNWEERSDYHHFYKHLKEINEWYIQRQEDFLEALLKNGSIEKDVAKN